MYWSYIFWLFSSISIACAFNQQQCTRNTVTSKLWFSNAYSLCVYWKRQDRVVLNPRFTDFKRTLLQIMKYSLVMLFYLKQPSSLSTVAMWYASDHFHFHSFESKIWFNDFVKPNTFEQVNVVANVCFRQFNYCKKARTICCVCQKNPSSKSLFTTLIKLV